MTTTKAELNLIMQIKRAEVRLENLRAKYIVKYGYSGLKMNLDGTISMEEGAP